MHKYKLTPITTAIITALFIPSIALGKKKNTLAPLLFKIQQKPSKSVINKATMTNMMQKALKFT